MTTFPFISQLKSAFQAVTGDLDGAKKTQESFLEAWRDHPLETVGDIADGIPVVGHIKGVVHFAMGDTEAGIRAEEGATRTLAVVAAGALVAASGGTAAPILAGVVAGLAADGVLTGIESARHGGKFDPQGMISVGSNVVKDIQRGENPSGDIFDGIAIVAGDGLVGSSAVKAPTASALEPKTTIYRVEGRSMVKMGAELKDFKAGDNQRIFYHKDHIELRERFPEMGPAEDLAPKPPLRDTNYPRIKSAQKENMKNPLSTLPSDASVFEDNGNMIFLNCGAEDRAYGYYADKLIDHRKFVKEYRELLPSDTISGVTEKTHTIKVKSFEVLTRDLAEIERDAITEAEKPPIQRELTRLQNEVKRLKKAVDKATNDSARIVAETKRIEAETTLKNYEKENWKGVLRVDVSKAEGQYGMTNSRYTPIFQKHIPGTFRSESLWIRHMPTPVLKLIAKNPVAFGKVRRFRYAKAARPILGGSTHPSSEGERTLRVAELANVKDEKLESEDVAPLALAHCRHVKTMAAPTEETSPEWTEHYEYLVKFDEDSEVEWYPEELIADDLQEDFYKRAMSSSKAVGRVKSSEDGKMVVERPDGSVDTVNSHQIFWNEQDPSTNQMSLSELDSVLYHIHRDDSHHGVRIPLDASSSFPGQTVAHATHCTERDGSTPVYFGSAIDFKGGVHPCKVAPSLEPYVRVGYAGKEYKHDGKYDLLPFVPELMALVPSYRGEVPEGRRPIPGGHESDGRKLYHAVAEVDGLLVPGKVAPHLLLEVAWIEKIHVAHVQA
ncbi:hypothetical protein N7456_001148 [Penicillium angulare]|uniref:Uncharacterized protein n=1 Tax=Penicillium angulare TaxID=116970 RepID=A0A9W9GEI6_9EURO|nr:hypothetical protein N7456_001148 [Penicillium angulare]